MKGSFPRELSAGGPAILCWEKEKEQPGGAALIRWVGNF